MFVLRWLAGTSAAVLLWLVALTYRVRNLGDDHRQAARAKSPGPLLYAIFHEQQLQAITTNDDRPGVSIASKSKDGDIIAAGLKIFAMEAARGSSSKGGREALAVVRDWVERGRSCGITVDGPRGPRRVAKVGIVRLAQLTGRPLIPAAYVPAASVRFLRAWDHFEIATPFARVVRSFQPPMYIGPADDLEARTQELTLAIAEADRAARRLLDLPEEPG